jgi:hypothetical protein
VPNIGLANAPPPFAKGLLFRATTYVNLRGWQCVLSCSEAVTRRDAMCKIPDMLVVEFSASDLLGQRLSHSAAAQARLAR